MTIGENIQRQRKTVGMTQKQLAEKIGVATITIQQYERNVREPKFETLARIADALSIDIGYFLNGTSATDHHALLQQWLQHTESSLALEHSSQYQLDNDSMSEQYVSQNEKVPASSSHKITDDDIKFALFGSRDVTDAQFEEVKSFARFIKERDTKKP